MKFLNVSVLKTTVLFWARATVLSCYRIW